MTANIMLTEEDLKNNIVYGKEDYDKELNLQRRNITRDKLNTDINPVPTPSDDLMMEDSDLLFNETQINPEVNQNRIVNPTFEKSPGEGYNPVESVAYGIGNFPSSAVNAASGLAVAAYNPIDTMGAIIDVTSGEMWKFLPPQIVEKKNQAFKKESKDIFAKSELYLKQAEEFEEKGNTSAAKRYRKFAANAVESASEMTDRVLKQTASATAVNKFYKERYGSWAGFRKAFAEDSAMVLTDVFTALKAGKIAAIASKTPKASKTIYGPPKELNAVANLFDKAADFVATPFTATGKGIKIAASGAGTAIGAGLDYLGPKVGVPALKETIKAGWNMNKSFVDNMTNPEIYGKSLVEKVKFEFNKFKKERGEAYNKRMQELKLGQENISFKPIDDLMETIRNTDIQWKTNKPNKKQLERWQTIRDKIDEYKKNGLNKADDFDQLKKEINDINSDIQYGTPESTVFSQIQAKIKSSIASDSPVYNKMMKEYIEASDYIDELNADFSLNKGRTGKSDTALRKLQSIFRNNANTNYGARIGNLQEVLSRNPDIAPGLAGMSMNAPFPRGIQSLIPSGTTGMLGAASLLEGGMSVPQLIPIIAAYLATQSPRLVGSGLYNASKKLRQFDDISGNIPSTLFDIGGDAAKIIANKNTLSPSSLLESINSPRDKAILDEEAFKQWQKVKGLF
tara:strand:- start:45 stop:2090 length:2046 start_codon:yes stop_codon:yes gene_type:complete